MHIYTRVAIRIAAIVLAVVALVVIAGATHQNEHPPHVQPEERLGATGAAPLAISGAPDQGLYEFTAFLQGRAAEEAARQEEERARAEERDRLANARLASPSAGPQAGSPPSSGSCGSDWDCFRECTIDHESRSSGMYSTNTGNGYYGAFQFAQSTWNSVAANAGYGEWVGRPASDAPQSIQDDVARFLWEHSGNQPWGGRC